MPEPIIRARMIATVVMKARALMWIEASLFFASSLIPCSPRQRG